MGCQVAEAMLDAQDVYQGGGPRRAIELLEIVGIPKAAERAETIRTSSPAACGSAS